MPLACKEKNGSFLQYFAEKSPAFVAKSAALCYTMVIFTVRRQTAHAFLREVQNEAEFVAAERGAFSFF